MTERTLERIIGSKLYGLVSALVLVWSFVGYWVSVSGWEFMFEWKLSIALAPIVVFTVNRIIKHYTIRYHRRKRQKEIMLHAKIRRMLDMYVA